MTNVKISDKGKAYLKKRNECKKLKAFKEALIKQYESQAAMAGNHTSHGMVAQAAWIHAIRMIKDIRISDVED